MIWEHFLLHFLSFIVTLNAKQTRPQNWPNRRKKKQTHHTGVVTIVQQKHPNHSLGSQFRLCDLDLCSIRWRWLAPFSGLKWATDADLPAHLGQQESVPYITLIWFYLLPDFRFLVGSKFIHSPIAHTVPARVRRRSPCPGKPSPQKPSQWSEW